MLRICSVVICIGFVALGGCNSQPEMSSADPAVSGAQVNADEIRAKMLARYRARGGANDSSHEMMCTTFKPSLCGANPGRWDYGTQTCDCAR